MIQNWSFFVTAYIFNIYQRHRMTECEKFSSRSYDFVTNSIFTVPEIYLMSIYFAWFLIWHANYVHIFLSKAPSLLGEVSHHGKQSHQVELEESFRICVQERLQRRVECSVVLDLVVIQDNETALCCVSYGLEHQVVCIQIAAWLLCWFTLPQIIGGYISQQARHENCLLHVSDSWAVSSQSQEQAVSVEFGLGRLHGSSWMWLTVPLLWWMMVGSSVQCKAREQILVNL